MCAWSSALRSRLREFQKQNAPSAENGLVAGERNQLDRTILIAGLKS
jgi:hypothetical protein